MKHHRLLALLLCAMLLTGCGATQAAQRHILDTGDFSKSEVRQAMSLVSRYFSWHFDGCTLQELRYDAEESAPKEAGWSTELGSEVIVLHSTFETDARGLDGSLNPNSTYKNYQWILVKNALGLWDLESWGY